MVIERAEFTIRGGRESEFEQEFATAGALIREAPGCRGVALARGVEEASKYLLLVEWDALESHEAFGRSASLARFRERVGGFFAGKPATEHFRPVLSL